MSNYITQLQALAKELSEGPPRVAHILVSHDADCPALGTGIGCTCEPDVQLVEREAFLAAHAQTRAQRRAAERKARKGGGK